MIAKALNEALEMIAREDFEVVTKACLNREHDHTRVSSIPAECGGTRQETFELIACSLCRTEAINR